MYITDQYDKMAADYREMQLNHYQLREKYDDLVEKMKFFTKVRPEGMFGIHITGWKNTKVKSVLFLQLKLLFIYLKFNEHKKERGLWWCNG